MTQVVMQPVNTGLCERAPASAAESTNPLLAAADVLDRVSDAFVALDRDWVYTYANQQAARIFGRRPEDMIGKHIWTEFPEGVGQPFYHAYQRAMRSQEFTFLEDYYAPYDRWFENRIYPSRDGLTIFFHDVTDRKRAQALLVSQNAILELIARGADLHESLHALVTEIEKQRSKMRCSVLLLDADGARLRHGAAPSLPVAFCEAIDGREVGPTAGSCGTAVYRRESVIVEDIARDPLWAEYRGFTLPHGLRSCWSTPIFDDRQRVLGTFAMYYLEPRRPSRFDQEMIHVAAQLASIAIVKHRGELERAEQQRIRYENAELEERNRMALEATRLKSEFLANMSHELRTPLNGVIGFAEFLSDEKPGPINPKQREYLGDILSCGRHLLNLINDVLDLAKVEAGKMDFQPVPTLLHEVVGETCAVVAPLAVQKSLRLDVGIEPDADRVELDPQRLKQVLFNLLSNAIKFTPGPGSVHLSARRYDERRLEVRVRDSGVGIRSEDLPHLFQEFRQLDPGAARQHEGTGLGLALTRRIVEGQGGSIGVESTRGVGTTFFFVLPTQFG